jgi:signal transduction histidine kinase/ActR/RegA family two-component response regulator
MAGKKTFSFVDKNSGYDTMRQKWCFISIGNLAKHRCELEKTMSLVGMLVCLLAGILGSFLFWKKFQQEQLARWKLQDQLRQTEEKWTFLLDNCHDGCLLLQPDLTVSQVNRAALQILGKTRLGREKVCGQHLTELFPGIAELPPYTQISQGICLRAPLEIKPYLFRSMLGEFSLALLFFPLAQGLGVLIFDQTNRKQIETSIRESETVTNAFLDAFQYSAELLDRDGRILGLNKRAGLQYREDNSALLGSQIFEHMSPSIRPARQQAFDEVIATGQPVRFLETIDTTIFDTAFFPIKDGASRVERIAIFSVDVTEARQVEAKLRIAKDAAESASLAKSQFLANMSHELRTPMHAIIGISKMLQKYGSDNLTAKQQEGLMLIHDSGNRLLTLINDILDLSKIESGKMAIHLEEFSLDELLANIKNLVINLIEEKTIDFFVQRSSTVPDAIISDPQKLNQVLMNILGNAVKFTKTGEIVLKISAQASQIFFEIRDTGIGIVEHELPFIFDEFRQVDSSDSRQYPGSGLGLALCKKLLHLLQGDIGVKSQVGSGTIIQFSIPLQAAPVKEAAPSQQELAAVPPAAPQVNEAGPAKILIAEDEEIGRATIRMMLESSYQLEFAHNGREAVEKYFVFQPDLVIMDIMMPELSGYESYNEIRRRASGPLVPIIALTARAMNEDRERILAHGFHDYLTKPIDDELLITTLTRALHQMMGATRPAEEDRSNHGTA